MRDSEIVHTSICHGTRDSKIVKMCFTSFENGTPLVLTHLSSLTLKAFSSLKTQPNMFFCQQSILSHPGHKCRKTSSWEIRFLQFQLKTKFLYHHCHRSVCEVGIRSRRSHLSLRLRPYTDRLRLHPMPKLAAMIREKLWGIHPQAQLLPMI